MLYFPWDRQVAQEGDFVPKINIYEVNVNPIYSHNIYILNIKGEHFCIGFRSK